MPSYVSKPLTLLDFEDVWQSVVDPGYGQAFAAAGDGGGFEAYRQAMAQLEAVSDAINTSMEAMYLLPWSGQTAAPASGPNLAEVDLTFSRSLNLQAPLILGAGTVWYDEVEPESAVDQGTTIQTGRRFTLQEDLVFLPGQPGPFTVAASAERPGYGYNYPQPGSINLVDQPGTGYSNTGATIAFTTPPLAPSSQQSFQLVAANVAEVFLPQHVGQYLEIDTTGNPLRARVIAYRAPSGSDGGAVTLELVVSAKGATHAGAFAPGEIVAVKNGATIVGYLTLKAAVVAGGAETVVGVFRSGSFAPVPGLTLLGTSSGATLTVDIFLGDPPFSGTMTGWRILDWVQDLGLTVTNAAQPGGGTSATLDALGYERKIRRISGEPDDLYRARVSTPADTVSPNAVRRMLNRTLTKGPLGLSWALREVGSPDLPGFFYDHDAYDYDAVVVVGAVAGQFVDGEQAWQRLPNGLVTQGHALVGRAVPAVAFVPGRAGVTGVPGPAVLYGMAGINPQAGGQYVPGVPIVGQASGASVVPGALDPAGANAGVNNEGLDAGPTRWRVLLDDMTGFESFRAFFLVEVQPSDAGEFGFFWGGPGTGEGGGFDYWDCAPELCFYDGFARSASRTYLAAYHGVTGIKAAGVTVEFVEQPSPALPPDGPPP